MTRAKSGPTRAAASAADDDDDSGSDSEDESLVKRQPKRKVPPALPPPAAKEEDEDDDESAQRCVVVEAAKTGRSKCRCCMMPIEQHEARVGMQGWMVGRQVMVWQHPKCFLTQVGVAVEANGRGKCKQTKEAFAPGEHTLTLVAHTTTARVKIGAAGSLLAPVLRAARTDATYEALAAASGAADAFASLEAADVAALRAGLAKGAAAAAAAPPTAAPPTTAPASAAPASAAPASAAPASAAFGPTASAGPCCAVLDATSASASAMALALGSKG